MKLGRQTVSNQRIRELTDEELHLVTGGTHSPFVPSPEPHIPPTGAPSTNPYKVAPGPVSPEPLVPPKFSF